MEYIVTSSGNKIHRQADIVGKDSISILGNSMISRHVQLQGNSDYKISISIGKYCYLNDGCKVVVSKKPVDMGNYIFVDSHSEIDSTNIGNRVLIGKNCRIEGIIGDCCIVDNDIHIFSSMVVPNYSYVTKDKFGLLVVEDLNYSYKKSIELDIKKMFIIGV